MTGEPTFFCEICGESRPIEPIVVTSDKLNSEPWADIVCAICHFVIATIRAPKPGIYALVRTAPLPQE